MALAATLIWVPVATAAPASAPAGTTVAAADATYAGASPGADCAGLQVVLTLFANQTFRMRSRDPGKAQGSDDAVLDIGRWARDVHGRFTLRGVREAPMLYATTTEGALRPLDALGKSIASTHDSELRRQAEVDRLPGPMRLQGMYRYLADAAVLTECRTGKRWPVFIDGGHLALERAYLAHRSQGGNEWVLASLSASFEMRESEPGQPPREMLRVESFDKLWPRETCAAHAPATASLLNTRWRAVEIDGRPVTLLEGQREPYIQLSTTGNRISGFTGCSRLSGGFEQGSDGFVYKGLTAAQQACAGAAGEQQARFIAALHAIASCRVVGDALHLRDAQGVVRLRFEALYLR